MGIDEKKVYFKKEIKRGSAGNMIVIVKFNSKASNFTEGNLTWCPTLDELDDLNQARKIVMENKQNIPDSKTKYCSECGFQIVKSANYCEECGNKLV